MTRRISISIPWDPRNLAALMARARAADEAGIDTIWINEGFGHDAFSGLTLLARETSRARRKHAWREASGGQGARGKLIRSTKRGPSSKQ